MNATAGTGHAGFPARTGDRTARAAIATWLQACAGVAAAVLVVGGITRLTHSGLSIVQWHPLSGAVPPLSDGDWTALFDQYRASPEGRLVNSTMSLEAFKPIFWWEYAHRMLARTAGLVFVLPLLWFIASGRMHRPLALRLSFIFALGALQGALGWYMVSSGLVDDPRVSPLRLAAHLAMALVLIGLLLWTSWKVRGDTVGRRPVPAIARLAVAAVFFMALTGALVAGTHAGLASNTFPLMNGALVPEGLMVLSPWYDNFLYNLVAVQFLHRAMALVVVAAILALWWQLRTLPANCAPRRLLLAALALQLGLGIVTLMTSVALVPAAAHQASAVLLYTGTLWSAFRISIANAH